MLGRRCDLLRFCSAERVYRYAAAAEGEVAVCIKVGVVQPFVIHVQVLAIIVKYYADHMHERHGGIVAVDVVIGQIAKLSDFHDGVGGLALKAYHQVRIHGCAVKAAFGKLVGCVVALYELIQRSRALGGYVYTEISHVAEVVKYDRHVAIDDHFPFNHVCRLTDQIHVRVVGFDALGVFIKIVRSEQVEGIELIACVDSVSIGQGQLIVGYYPFDLLFALGLSLRGKRGKCKGEQQTQAEQKRVKLFRVFHIAPPLRKIELALQTLHGAVGKDCTGCQRGCDQYQNQHIDRNPAKHGYGKQREKPHAEHGDREH